MALDTFVFKESLPVFNYIELMVTVVGRRGIKSSLYG